MKKMVLVVILPLLFAVPFQALAVFTLRQGGTGATNFSQGGFLFGNGTNPIGATYAPSFNFLTATSANATSTFSGNVSVEGKAKFGSGTGMLSIVNGFLDTAIIQSPLTFTDNTLSISAAGSDGEIQFNDGGGLGGDNAFTFNKTTNVLTIEDISGVSGTGFTLTTPNVNTGANIDITAGSAVSGNNAGGSMQFRAGDGFGTGPGGSLSFDAGLGGSNGVGGSLNFSAGNASVGNNNGGDIGLIPGAKSGTGADGRIYFTDPSIGVNAIFDTASLTIDKTFIFPNFSGTFGLLEANQTWSGFNKFSAGASATTTVEFGKIGDVTSRACFNTKNTEGNNISFYFVGTAMVVESNLCK